MQQRCQNCANHYQTSPKTHWYSHDMLVSGKVVEVQNITVLTCGCGETPVLPSFDSFLEQIKEVAHAHQVWRWRASGWCLVSSGPLQEEPKKIRAVPGLRWGLEDGSESDSEDTWRSLSPTH